MLRTVCIAAVLLSSAVSVMGNIAQGADRSSRETDQRIEKALQQIRSLAATSDSGPGIAIGITDRERLRGVVVHGYSDLKARTPVTADTKFAIGSISKSFTAVTLLQLLDEGKFDPQASVSRYLPQFHVKTQYPEMTGHTLLNHTSGLPNYLPHLSSMRYVVHALHDFQPSYAPGEHFEYSNTGYQVLGYVIERIDGDAFASVLKRRVLDRLGMSATLPQLDDAARQVLAVSYQRWPYDDRYVEANWFPYTAADGGIAATPGDLSTYVRFILNRGAAPNGRLLSEAAFRKFITPALDNYAYGVAVSGTPGRSVVSHGGAIYGFRSRLEAHIDEGFGVTFMSNGSLDGKLIKQVVGVVTEAFGGKPDEDKPSEATPPAYSLTDAANYAGRYQRQDGAVITFSAAEDGSLLLHRPDNKHLKLVKMGRDTYGASEVGAYLFFGDAKHADRGVQEVSHGADWYVKEGSALDNKSPAVPTEYRSYVGRYLNHSDEGPDVRVFVKRGRLMLAPAGDSSYVVELEPSGPVSSKQGSFRPTSPAYSPERLVFDTLDDGVTLRLQMSGVPLYRVDIP